jgi:hypothetical protein
VPRLNIWYETIIRGDVNKVMGFVKLWVIGGSPMLASNTWHSHSMLPGLKPPKMEDQWTCIYLRHMSHVLSHLWLIVIIEGGALKETEGFWDVLYMQLSLQACREVQAHVHIWNSQFK